MRGLRILYTLRAKKARKTAPDPRKICPLIFHIWRDSPARGVYKVSVRREMKPRGRKGSNIMKKKIASILQGWFEFAEKYHIYDYTLR